VASSALKRGMRNAWNKKENDLIRITDGEK
jgi:hypothetical protein